MKLRFTAKFSIRVRQSGRTICGVDWPRSWERAAIVPAKVRPEGKWGSRISTLKSRCKPPIVSCRKSVTGGRKQPEGKQVDASLMVRHTAGMP